MSTVNKNINKWADFWRYQIGVNAIPAKTKNKRPLVQWEQYQSLPITEEQHNEWKQQNKFKDGMAIIAGKVLHNDAKKNLYLILVDLDNQKAIDEFCTRNGVITPLSELANSNSVIVEQHEDAPDKAHVIFYATHPFPKKSSDKAALSTRLDSNQVPAIEVKGAGEHGLLFVTPSPHKNGHNYEIIGTRELDTVVYAFESHIDNICSKYGIPYLNGNGNGNGGNNLTPIKELFNEDTKIYEGHNRHEAILRVMESLLSRNNGILTQAQIKQLASDWNNKHCIPQLENREYDKQWNDAIKFIEQHQHQHQQTTGQGQRLEKYQELAGNVYYQINEKPEKYIIAYKQKSRLIETTARSSKKEIGDKEIIEYNLFHNKTYLTCIPIKIAKHKNPLEFLGSAQKYTFSFKDSTGEVFTFSQKTLREIMSGLHDLGHVQSDGAEGALGAMILSFKENELIENNEDIGYIGFFLDKDKKKIVASGIEKLDVDPSNYIDKLIGALAMLEESKPRYPDRLDLLATSITWGMVAPINFVIKIKTECNYFLKALHFYGFSNASKSSSGKYALALDGHHNDTRFVLNFARIDTIARLGEQLSRTTFPLLIDEADLNNEKHESLVNSIKSAIDGLIVRSKFRRNTDLGLTDLPSLSAIIFTSNPAPPLNNSAYMRRIIDRSFSQAEAWKEDDPKAIEFKQFMIENLGRLKALGDFRNWFIMNHQSTILDETRSPPLDLGFKILEEAYKTAGRIMPEWLKLRLPENQLVESIEDNNVIVKRAFEKYIAEEFNRALTFWRLQNVDQIKTLPNDTIIA